VNGADPHSVELALVPAGTVVLGPATELDDKILSLQTMFARVDLVCLESIDLSAGRAVLKRVPACA
jgi:hypothetical protein